MKVPRKDFELFKKTCLSLQKEWGLTGWELTFHFSSLLSENQAACIDKDLEAHNTTLTLSSEVPAHCKSDPKGHAKHEMLHLLLARVSEYGKYRFLTSYQQGEAEHELIQQLMKIIP